MGEPNPSFDVTYRRADGEPMHDEYGWLTALDGLEEDEYPTELVEEVWLRTSVRTFWHIPTALYSCTADQECDEDAVAWEQHDDEWVQVCEEHRASVGEPVEEDA